MLALTLLVKALLLLLHGLGSYAWLNVVLSHVSGGNAVFGLIAISVVGYRLLTSRLLGLWERHRSAQRSKAHELRSTSGRSAPG